ncbi:YSIRK-type signal peptide-containing protein [Staphylococcus simulans]|uniref:YSIRK-type signal peptide-containing protein n=1 Tax=Staphylococcus simulans TaxID=1286 RepID=UPI0021CE3FDC|nr:YSIRK-type signal peptide-containing protein [Staphylococcus simulans]UXR45536.1 YSIRK-type signal peptide-containing protein [Staphylococcus simulans]
MKKKQLFSLRKLSVGIASVSLGTLVFLGGGQTVSAETQDLKQKTQEAYNTINNLPSLTDAEKDAYNQQILEQSGQNNSNFDAILAEAQQDNTQAAEDINYASQDAYNIINNLPSLTDAQKDAYNQQILETAGANNTDFDKILDEAQATNDQAAQDINQASLDAYNTINNLPSLTDAQKDAYNQQILETAGANNTNFDAILAEAQKVNEQAAQNINQASQEAYNTINNLPNLTDAQKYAYNQRILEVAGTNSTDFDAILSEAKAADAQAAKETPEALEALNKATQDAYNTINNLPNLTDAQKDDFNHQILVESGQNSTEKFEAILAEAKALDAKQAPVEEDKADDKEKQEDSKSEDKATEEEAKPEDNKSEEKADQKEQPKEDAKTEGKVKEEKTPENKTDEKAVEKDIKKAADEKTSVKERTKAAHDAVNKLENLTQKQKEAYIAQIDKSAKEDKGAQFEAILTEAKAEDAKVAKENAKPKADAKELPATGESDEVLFGLLSGSLFASAGTLFLLNARRKESK